MSDDKDYSKWPLEELLKEEKKIKKSELISAGLIGFLIGVIIFGVAKNGFGFLYIFLPLILISGIYKNSQKHKNDLKQVQSEINAKNTK